MYIRSAGAPGWLCVANSHMDRADGPTSFEDEATHDFRDDLALFTNVGMQMFQQPDKITIFYSDGHEVRHVRMNESRPVRLTPSWYGDSVAYYEGDTLVSDPVGSRSGRSPCSTCVRHHDPS